jgi:hypothetical protein
MRSMKPHPLWDEKLEAALPLAGPLVAFIGMFIILLAVMP